jgi:hypothetical protein
MFISLDPLQKGTTLERMVPLKVSIMPSCAQEGSESTGPLNQALFRYDKASRG